jgi:hypothetical protein
MATPNTAGADAAIADEKALLTQESEVATKRQAALDTTRQTSFAQRESELRPHEAALNTELQQPSPVKAETPPLPDFKPQPIVDAKEYNELSMGLIGMALIGGAVSKGNWLGVSATLNGALDGYLKGNKEAAAKGFQDYKTQFEAAKAKEERANKEFEQALTNRNKTINEKLQMVKLIAAKYDRQDLRMAAEQKSIDAIWKQYEAHRTALNSLEVRHSDTINNITIKMEREGRLAGGGGGSDGKLTPEASQLAYDMTARGVALPGGNTKYGNSLRIQMLNEWAAAGKTADDMAGGRADVKANQSALTQVTKDLAAIGPYKRMLDKNAGIVIQLAQKVEDKGTRTNSPWINEKLNTLQTKGVSDPDVQEMLSQMHFVQTEAARVLNNPRLVGQLTDSARKDMQDVADGSMPVKTISRVVKRIMTDGNNRYDEMINEKNSLSGTLHGGGGAAAPGGGAVMKFDAQGNPVK